MKISKIEKGIKFPKKLLRPHRTYPLHMMEIGDSFFIEHEDPVTLRMRVHNSVTRWSERNGFTFKMISYQCPPKTGVRVWRES